MLKKLQKWIEQSGPGTPYHGFFDRLSAVLDRLSGEDPGAADTDGEALELIAEIEAINPQHLADVAKIRSIVGLAPLNPSPTDAGKGRWGPDKEKRTGSGKGKGKRSKHGRKDRAMEKRAPRLDEIPEEEEVAAQPGPVAAAETPPRLLRDAEKDRVTAALATLRQLRTDATADDTIDDYLDDDFFDEIDEAESFARGIISSNSVETPVYVDNLERQATGLQDRLDSAEDEREAEIAAEEEERRRAEEDARRLEEEAEARRLAEIEEAEERALEEAARAAEKKAAAAAKPAKRKKKAKPMSLADFNKMVEKESGPLPKFPDDFRLSDYSAAVHYKTEELGVDRHFMGQTGETGYVTGFYRLTPKPGAPLGYKRLLVHAHFNANGRFRLAPKVIEEGYEGLLDGTSFGTAIFSSLTNFGAAKSIGVLKQ